MMMYNNDGRSHRRSAEEYEDEEESVNYRLSSHS